MNSLIRNLTTRQLVVIGFVVPLLCTLLVAWLQWDAVNNMAQSRIIGRQLRATQVTLGVFRYSLSDAESAQFRFILTHDPDDLALYRKLIAQTSDQFTMLRTLAAPYDIEEKYLDQIEPLLQSKETTTEQSFTLEQGGNHVGAMQIISSEASRSNMLQIEGAIDVLENIAAQLVVQRQFIFTHTLKVTVAASVAGLAVNLGCISAVLLLIRRMQQLQSSVTREALHELINYEDGKLTIEEYLSRRSMALSAHGQAQIEAEKLISQLERRRSRRATERIQPVQGPPK